MHGASFRCPDLKASMMRAAAQAANQGECVLVAESLPPRNDYLAVDLCQCEQGVRDCGLALRPAEVVIAGRSCPSIPGSAFELVIRVAACFVAGADPGKHERVGKIGLEKNSG